jgi:hypothetical protein
MMKKKIIAKQKNKNFNASSVPQIPSYFNTSTYDLLIFESKIAKSGLGVFTNERIPCGVIIDEYVGKLYEITYSPSKYYFEIKKGLGIDAFDYPRCFMAMINDVHGTSHTINCEFVVNTEDNRVFIKSIIDIEQGCELYLSYGNQYWESEKV